MDQIELPLDLPAWEDEYEENKYEDEYEDEYEENKYESASEEPPKLILLTLADAQRAMARVKKHQSRAAELAAVYDTEIARLTRRKEEVVKPYLRRAQFYTFALEQFAIAEVGKRKNDKTLRLPDGDLTVRNQAPEWVWPEDDKALVAAVWAVMPSLIYSQTVTLESVNKNDVKRMATVVDGKAHLSDENGELHELPVAVQKRDPKVTITLA